MQGSIFDQRKCLFKSQKIDATNYCNKFFLSFAKNSVKAKNLNTHNIINKVYTNIKHTQ